MAGCRVDFLSITGQDFIKKAHQMVRFLQDRHISRVLSRHKPVFTPFWVVDMINLHFALLQMSSLLPAPNVGRICGGLFEVAVRRDCPFHPNLIVSSLLLLSSGHPARYISRYVVPYSPDFPLIHKVISHAQPVL